MTNANEKMVSEGEKFLATYDGVFLTEAIYRDYVIKAEKFERLQNNYDELQFEYDKFQESNDRGCVIDVCGGPYWFIGGLIIGVSLTIKR
jgi:hypothetical protein